MPGKKRFVLIDSNAVMHRAYHAMPPLTTKDGRMVGVVYGFTSVLLRIIKELKPDCIACAFDMAGGTFRDAIFDRYKAGRKKPDQEFYDQIDGVKEVVRAMNIPILERAGFEADDVIGTVSYRVAQEGFEVLIATGDMDVLQLVDEHTRVYTFKKGISETVLYDAGKVEERYGITPGQVIDYKALRGDASDNIPGVKGIGEKTAVGLLAEFGTLDNLYRNLDSDAIRPKVREKLVADREMAEMSRELATIKRDVELDFRSEDCLWGDYDREELVRVFQKYEFFSLINRLKDLGEGGEKRMEEEKKGGSAFALRASADRPVSAPAERSVLAVDGRVVKFVMVHNDKEMDAFLKRLSGVQECVLMTLESEHRIAERHLVGILFAPGRDELVFVPVAHSEKGAQSLFSEKKTDSDFLGRLKPYLEDASKCKLGYDQKRDMEALAAYGIELKGLGFDARLAAYLLDPGKRDYSLEKVVFEQLGLSGVPGLDGAGEEAEPARSLVPYIYDLKEKLAADLERVEMGRLFYKIEMPLIPMLCRLEGEGVRIDSELLAEIAVETDREIERLTAKIHELTDETEFNINSSRQLAEVLFVKLGLSTKDIKKGKTGYSVAASELEKLQDLHPVIGLISEYRELNKLKTTYIDTLPKLVNLETGRLHTTFHQDVTATGRLSSSDPNLQNIPVRTPIGRRIREAFVAEDGRTLLSADYSQIELRIIATIAEDERMREIFLGGQDIHTATAAKVRGISLGEVTPEMRRAAKALNFGVIYGMSVFGFARSAGISREEAKLFIDSYMRTFSGVARYIEESKENARQKGYAETLWGRRRYLPELDSSNALVRQAAERMAINMPIQGTAADLMKINMLRIGEWAEGFNAAHADAVRILLQVHDELLFSVRTEYLKEVGEEVRRVMENGHVKFDGHDIEFSVPIEVSLKSGGNWGELE